MFTQPDRPAGRGHHVQPSPVKRVALELGLATLEPLRLREALPALQALEADLFALASYGKIVPQALLDLPRLGALNVHPSLLPLYRGATPLQTQLRDGVREGGVTLMLMDAGLDTGDIVLQSASPIGATENYGELHDRFAQLGAELLAEAFRIASREGSLPRTPQSARDVAPERIAATSTRPLDKADLEIDWHWPARRVVDCVRALAPAPGARAELAGERVKILRATIVAASAGSPNGNAKDGDAPHGYVPGMLRGTAGSAALVECGDGPVALERIVPPKRGEMDGASFARARSAR